jgi:S-adenosylmethionine:tRNA ribosyltransferase-isomerase
MISMDLDDFDYSLPRELIAQRPPPKRDASRLMVLGTETVHDNFENLSKYLTDGDVLVLNDSKVINARLTGNKDTGGRIELLLLNVFENEASCLIRGKKIQKGTVLHIGTVTCKVTDKAPTGFRVVFDQAVEEVLQRYGEVPLPHYIKEELNDPARYQTVYAKRKGSVAAPTAGLHLTKEGLQAVEKKGVKIAFLTLHIGPSTFLPLKNGGHNSMQPEHFSIDKKNAEMINKGIENGSLIPVGTSSVKALESAAVDSRIAPAETESELFISPGYRFNIPVKGMITNFHLPKSTLLLMVCALFGKERILRAYSEAIQQKYQFYSFGDAMLIMR